MDKKYDFIVVGTGLAGMTVALKLAKDKERVLLIEKEHFLGGRTSSWNDNGFEVESGFHKQIGYYKRLPKLLKEVGVKLDDIVAWEKETEIIVNKHKKIVFGISPFHNPGTFIKDFLGNREVLSIKDKLSMIKLFIRGFIDYKFNPKELDNYSILEYSKKLNITDNVIDYIVTSLSTGIFFMSKEEYSAKLFFGLFYPALFRVIKLRIGAYKKGMTDILINPIAEKFKKYGGEVLTNTKVTSLIEEQEEIKGVKTTSGNYYGFVVLATDLGNTKEIIETLDNKNKEKILSIPTTSAISVQIDLTKKIMLLDRATFAPLIINTSFTEESRTTFKRKGGRLSIILGNPEKYINLKDETIFKLVVHEFKKIGINIKKDVLDYRIVKHKYKYYRFSKGNDDKRCLNDIGIKNLIVAGDYTRQKFYCTMEGAVISGINAYEKIIKIQNIN